MAEEEQEEQKKSGGKGLIITLIVVLVLMLIGIGVLTFFLLTKDGGGHAKTEETQKVEEHTEATDTVVVPPNFKQYEPPEPGGAPEYFAMEPFVVNFKGEGQAKYLAVNLKFMSYYPQVIADMENYRPILRNDITALLRIQTYTEMNQDNGSEILRQRILEKAREVIKKHKIYPDLLEDVYFERFVMQ